MPQQQRTPSKPPRYFAIPAEIDRVDALDAHIGSGSGSDDDSVQKFWNALKARSAIARHPHVMIVHSKQLPDCMDLWESCAALYALPPPLLFPARLGRVVTDRRIMAATVEDLRMHDPVADEAQAGSVFVLQLGHMLYEGLQGPSFLGNPHLLGHVTASQ